VQTVAVMRPAAAAIANASPAVFDDRVDRQIDESHSWWK